MGGVLSGALDQLRYRRNGVLAQLLTFGAVLLPVVLRLGDALVFYVQVAALTTLFLQSSALAISVRLPVASDAKQARSRIHASLWNLIGSAGVLLIVAVVLSLVGGPSVTLLCAAPFLVAQGVYVIAMAALTRLDDYQGILNLRLAYAVAVVPLTVAGCLLDVSGPVFVALNTVPYVAGTFHAMRRARLAAPVLVTLLFPLRLKELRAELADARTLSLAYVVGQIPVQVAALSLGRVGELQTMWAANVRVTSGFQTVGMQLLGPEIDTATARGVRAGDRAAVRAALQLGIVMASMVGVGAAAVAALATAWVDFSRVGDLDRAVVLVVCAVGYAGFSSFVAVLGRFVGMVGNARQRLAWDMGRGGAAIAVVLLLRDGALVVALSLVCAVSVSAYVWMCRHALDSMAQRAAGFDLERAKA